MVVALAVSVALSAVMLLLDNSESKTISKQKEEARARVARWYTLGEPNQNYQVLLREAEQAHSRGDNKLERRRYRQVLDMLKDERKNEIKGLTGSLSGEPPNDRHLEEQLSILLTN